MPPKDRQSADWSRAIREAAPYLGLGTQLAASVLLGLGAGYLLDQRFSTRPIWFLVGAVLGLVAAGVQFVRSTGRRP